MASLKMAGVDLRSIVKKDEPDLVFLNAQAAAVLFEELNELTWGIQRDYAFWLMTIDPMDFLEKDLLTKRFFHPSLVEKADIDFSARNRVALDLEYQWGWMRIQFIDHAQDPIPGDDRIDEWLANPEAFTRDQKLFAIEIQCHPIWIAGFKEHRAENGDHSFTDCLIDMDLIEIALKYKDAFFDCSYENQYEGFLRPGRHIKRFEDAPDTWIFYRHDLFGMPKKTWGDSAFFELRKRAPDLKALYVLGKDWPDLLRDPPFSGLSDYPYDKIGEGYVADFALFRGRDPLELFRPKTDETGL